MLPCVCFVAPRLLSSTKSQGLQNKRLAESGAHGPIPTTWAAAKGLNVSSKHEDVWQTTAFLNHAS